MQLYKSKFLTINFEAIKELITLEWSNESDNMVETTFKNEILQIAHFLMFHNPRVVLLDASLTNFVTVPELQLWVKEHVLSISAQVGICKTAIILPQNFISKLAVNQIFDEDKSHLVTRKYFEEKIEAENWLFTK